MWQNNTKVAFSFQLNEERSVLFHSKEVWLFCRLQFCTVRHQLAQKKNVSRFTLGVHAILNLITLSYCHDFSFQPWWLFFFRLSLHSLEAALSSGCNHSVPNWILFSKILEFWNLDSYLLFWQSGRVSWVNVVSQKLDYSKTIIGKRNSHQN